jgi:hypothetical protein
METKRNDILTIIAICVAVLSFVMAATLPRKMSNPNVTWPRARQWLFVAHNEDGSTKSVNDPFQVNVFDPNSIADANDTVAVFICDANDYPNGCEVNNFWIETSEETTYSVNFERWDGVEDASPETMATVATSSSFRSSTTSVSNATLSPGQRVIADLPTSNDPNFLHLGGSIKE